MASSAFTQKCHFKRTVSAEAFFLLNTGSYNTVLHWASEMSELRSRHQLETLRLAAWVSWRPPVWTSMEISLYQPPTLISSLQNGKMSTQHPPHHGDVDRAVHIFLFCYCMCTAHPLIQSPPRSHAEPQPATACSPTPVCRANYTLQHGQKEGGKLQGVGLFSISSYLQQLI